MVIPPVHLDHQTATYEEVDAADAGQGNLTQRREPEAEHPHEEDRLDARLASSVDSLPLVDAKTTAKLGCSRRVLADQRVERAEGDIALGAGEVVIERIVRTGDEPRRVERARRPVDDGAIIGMLCEPLP